MVTTDTTMPSTTAAVAVRLPAMPPALPPPFSPLLAAAVECHSHRREEGEDEEVVGNDKAAHQLACMT
jgi:hypothetical protein